MADDRDAAPPDLADAGRAPLDLASKPNRPGDGRPTYDLFVLYARTDEWFVRGYLLPSLGLPPDRVALLHDEPLGQTLVREIEARVLQSRLTLAVLSPASGAERWADFAEALASHVTLSQAGLVPLLLEGPDLPPRLDLRGSLDFRNREHWGDQTQRLRKLLEQPAPPPDELPCPYPGLRPFRATEAGQFYGRVREADELLQRLRAGEREIYVVGPSGSGKSSLLAAGVLPRLQQAGTSYLDEPFLVRTMRPGEHPTDRLGRALRADAGPPISRLSDAWPPVSCQNVDEAPPSSALTGDSALASALPGGFAHVDNAPPSALASDNAPASALPGGFAFDTLGTTIDALLQAHPGQGRLLLFVDQLEELFTLADLSERRRFFEALRALRRTPRCSLVLALRADFFGSLMESELWPDLEDRFPALRVAPLRGKALAEAIEAPAHALGAAFEPRLAERLVADAANEPGALPLLQEALRLLWDKRRARLLRLDDYEALGADDRSGLAVALARRADAAVSRLSKADFSLARRMLLRLISFGEGRPNTRRQQTKDALLSAGDPAAASRVLEALTRARLLTVSEDQSGSVDLAHEALLTGWPALFIWLGELHEAEQRRRQLEAKAREWERLGRGREGLLGEKELPEFECWVTTDLAIELGLDATMLALVAQSRNAITRAKRRLYLLVGVLAAFSLTVSGLAIGLIRQRSLTEQSLEAAASAAEEVTFTIERDLRPIAGASAVRERLLKRSKALLERLEQLAGEQRGARRLHAATIQSQANLLLEQGKLAEAGALYQQAHAYFVHQATREPTNAGWQRDLSLSYERLGGVALTAGKLDEATRTFQAGLAIAQKLAAQEPTNAGWQRDLSVLHTKLGDVAVREGKLDEAMRAFQAGLAIRQTLAAQDPANADWQRDLSASHGKLGGVALEAGKLDEAMRAFQASLAITQKLAAQDPTNADWQRDLSASHERLGDVALKAGKLDEAMRAFQASLAITQKLAAQDPTNADWQYDLCVSHERFGDVAVATGKLDEARRAFLGGLAILQKLAVLDPTNAGRRKALVLSHTRLADVSASLHQREDAQRHYRAACAQIDALERDGLLRQDAQMTEIRSWLEAFRQEHKLTP